MKQLSVWILTFLFLSSASNVNASPQATRPSSISVTCHKATGGAYWWNYCVHKSSVSQSQDVLYYFHGLDGSEYEWEDSPVYQKVYQLWGAQAPIVVSITYGSIWLLAEVNSSRYSGLYENFIHTSLPYIEKTEKLNPLHRLLLGLSMGGFNAAQVYLKDPSLFSKVALACPALTTIGPYDGDAAIQAYISRTHAFQNNVYNALYLTSSYFPTEASWEKSAPIRLATESINPEFPPLYVSGGLQDEYGFFEGAKAFVDTANAKGAKAAWIPLQGPHCTYDWQGTALFLIAE